MSAVDLDAARRALHDARAVVPHTDADGLAAGAVALRARSEAAAAAVLLRRGQTPFGSDPPLPPGAVAVLDWGVRPLARPGLIVDHHAPESEGRGDQIVVSGYGEEPETTTAALIRRIVPDAPPWLAALGAVADLGDAGFRLPECAGAPRGPVRRLVPLVNAPRRLPDGPVRDALALLVESDDASAALADERVRALEESRREWRAAFERVKRVAPVVGPHAALVRFSSPYQLHPLVAAQWSRRLAPRVVVAANDGYLPDRVAFAVRGGSGDLRAFLRRALPDVRGEFAHGHDRATGGIVSPDDFARLLVALGLAAGSRAGPVASGEARGP